MSVGEELFAVHLRRSSFGGEEDLDLEPVASSGGIEHPLKVEKVEEKEVVEVKPLKRTISKEKKGKLIIKKSSQQQQNVAQTQHSPNQNYNVNGTPRLQTALDILTSPIRDLFPQQQSTTTTTQITPNLSPTLSAVNGNTKGKRKTRSNSQDLKTFDKVSKVMSTHRNY